MDLLPRIFAPLVNNLKGGDGYFGEYNRYHRSIRKNPTDHGLKSDLVKVCLRHHFAGDAVPEEHLQEAVGRFEEVSQSDFFDLEIHYLMGRYHMDRDDERAHRVFLDGITRFNKYVEKNPGLKPDYVDLAYAIALNLMTLQSGAVDPELDRFFRTLRKSFPLHVKRIELESEMEKVKPDPAVLRKLSLEIKALRAAHDEKHPKFTPAD